MASYTPPAQNLRSNVNPWRRKTEKFLKQIFKFAGSCAHPLPRTGLNLTRNSEHMVSCAGCQSLSFFLLIASRVKDGDRICFFMSGYR